MVSLPCSTPNTDKQKPSSLFHLYSIISAYVPFEISIFLSLFMKSFVSLLLASLSLRHAQPARPPKPKPPAGPPPSPQTQTNMIDHMLKGMAKQPPSTVIVFLSFIQCFSSLAAARVAVES